MSSGWLRLAVQRVSNRTTDVRHSPAKPAQSTEAYDLLCPPKGLVREILTAGEITLADKRMFLYGASALQLEPNAQIMVNDRDPVRQFGIGTITILSGSLTIELLLSSVSDDLDAPIGMFRVGVALGNGVSEWCTLTDGESATLVTGDVAVFENVTFSLSGGNSGARMLTTGAFPLLADAGCPSVCWQYP